MSRGGLIWLISAWLALCAGCGDKKKKPNGDGESAENSGDKAPAVEELPQLPLGVESPRVFNYKWGKGRKLFDTEVKPNARGDSADWKAAIEAGKKVLEKDPNHLSAHFVMGIAYANTGGGSEAARHLSTALAGDWAQWGPTLAEDRRLAEFFSTDKGKAVLALNEAYRTAFAEQAAAGLLVVARRSGFKRPEQEGKQYAASRAELYSFNLETKRYLRLTHTADSVLGFIESPSKDRIAYVSATRAHIDPQGDNTFVNARVGVVDTETFVAVGERASLKEQPVELMLFYAEGEELQLQTIAPNNLYSVDWETGKLRETAGKQFADFETLYEAGQADRKQPILYVTLDMVRVLLPWGAVTRPHNDLVVTRYQVSATKQMITLPSNAGVKMRRITLSPNGGYTTFVGIGDACGGKTDTALYIADTRTGSPKLVHRGKGLHTVRWIDDSRFAFEAEPTEIRVYDVTASRAVETIKNRAGIALGGLSNTVRTEHCPQPVQPAVQPGVDAGLEDEVDPDEVVTDEKQLEEELDETGIDEAEFED